MMKMVRHHRCYYWKQKLVENLLHARYCAEHFSCTVSIQFSQWTWEVESILTPILQTGKLSLREGKGLAWSHTIIKQGELGLELRKIWFSNQLSLPPCCVNPFPYFGFSDASVLNVCLMFLLTYMLIRLEEKKRVRRGSSHPCSTSPLCPGLSELYKAPLAFRKVRLICISRHFAVESCTVPDTP